MCGVISPSSATVLFELMALLFCLFPYGFGSPWVGCRAAGDVHEKVDWAPDESSWRLVEALVADLPDPVPGPRLYFRGALEAFVGLRTC